MADGWPGQSRQALVDCCPFFEPANVDGQGDGYEPRKNPVILIVNLLTISSPELAKN